MSRFSLDKVIQNLNTNQVEKQVLALEQATEIVNSLALKAVDTLRRGPNRFLVAERLQLLGSVVIPHLEKLLSESNEEETKILAALVLLQFDSWVGIPCLLDAIGLNKDYGGLVAKHLAKKGIKDALPPIINRLLTCQLQEVDLVVNLLDALEKLGGEIPLELRQRLAAPDTPWQIRTMIGDRHLSVNVS
ncbi:MAG: hypothetical protein PUP92_20555 [Rhizonema sp. PD38]|nr:hypothetical protein [Rhizonema sp. PD38]